MQGWHNSRRADLLNWPIIRLTKLVFLGARATLWKYGTHVYPRMSKGYLQPLVFFFRFHLSPSLYKPRSDLVPMPVLKVAFCWCPSTDLGTGTSVINTLDSVNCLHLQKMFSILINNIENPLA